MCYLCHEYFNLSDPLISSIDSNHHQLLNNHDQNLDTENKENSNTIDTSSIRLTEEHLLMADTEIQAIKNAIGIDNIYEVYISDGTDNVYLYSSEYQQKVLTQTREPEDWQYKKIRDSLALINENYNFVMKEVSSKDEADLPIYISDIPNAYSISGSWSDGSVYMTMSHDNNMDSATWEKIFVHELGHYIAARSVGSVFLLECHQTS